MKKMILKGANYVGYLTGCYGVGYLLGKIVEKFFGGFLTDEAYAEQHPYRYLLGVLAIFACELTIGLAIVWWPLMKLCKFINEKIDGIDKSEEDKEWD